MEYGAGWLCLLLLWTWPCPTAYSSPWVSSRSNWSKNMTNPSPKLLGSRPFTVDLCSLQVTWITFIVSHCFTLTIQPLMSLTEPNERAWTISLVIDRFWTLLHLPYQIKMIKDNADVGHGNRVLSKNSSNATKATHRFCCIDTWLWVVQPPVSLFKQGGLFWSRDNLRQELFISL